MFLGIDLSTQQAKAVVTDKELVVVACCAVDFDQHLPQFKTTGGVHVSADGLVITSPVHMWLQAMDLLMHKLKHSGVCVHEIEAISGAGQQHGTVYWKKGADKLLTRLNPNHNLSDELQNAFTIVESPVWMDSSTTAECAALEKTVGGALKLAEITGSRAYERFSANQIAKIAVKNKVAYDQCERISLVSSFCASLLLGKYSPIDLSDGSGMNLLDMQTATWSNECLQATAPQLRDKLGEPIASNTVLGNISTYFVEKYGFSPECKIVAFTGDNPSSVAGLNLCPGDVAVSLGTSDTVLTWMHKFVPNVNAHVLFNPVDATQYMGMLCFKNGSLTREKVRKLCGCDSWDSFAQLLESTHPGNDGNIGFYFDLAEILPDVKPDYTRFDKQRRKVDKFCASVEARAVIEHQCLAKFVHLRHMQCNAPDRVLVTGGASRNQNIVQVLADVFNCAVFSLSVSDSAALGGARRAKFATTHNDWTALPANKLTLVATPDLTAHQVYERMGEAYAQLEKELNRE